MRPWERESESPLPEESPPPARQARGGLSSMVVRLPENENFGDADDAKKEEKSSDRVMSLSPPRRQGWSQPLANGSGGSNSTRHQKKLERLPYDSGFNDREGAEYDREGFKVRNGVGRLRDYSPSYRCGGRDGGKLKDISSPYRLGTDESMGERFRERSPNYVHGRDGRKFRKSDYGHGRIGGRFQQFPASCDHGRVIGRFQDISFANERERDGVRFHDSSLPYELERNRTHFSSAFERGKSGGRYRDHSPPYGIGRDARLFERCFNDVGPEILFLRKEEVNRNNPNIAPRAGDWFCQNPLCGNLNFARRETCNNCDEHRYGTSDGRMHGNPYPYRGVPLDNRNPHVDLGPSRRETNGYRSPPHGWARDQPRDFPVIRHGRRLPDDPFSQRGRVEYHKDMGDRMDSKFYRPLIREWDPREREGGRYTNFSCVGRECDRDYWIQETICRSLSPRKEDPARKDYRRSIYDVRGQGRHVIGRR